MGVGFAEKAKVVGGCVDCADESAELVWSVVVIVRVLLCVVRAFEADIAKYYG